MEPDIDGLYKLEAKNRKLQLLIINAVNLLIYCKLFKV
jgi:hypothetical protein